MHSFASDFGHLFDTSLVFFTFRYATVKKEPPLRPPAPARRPKRSAKSIGSSFKDSPFPERQQRGVIGPSRPSRPPRRGSSSSLIDQHKYGQLPAFDCQKIEEF